MTVAGVYTSDWAGFNWSPWFQITPQKEEIKSLETECGFYRVRHEAYDGLVYIGETGRSVSGRVHSLVNGIFDDAMPYSDPHTASPSMWAIHDQHGGGFEVSGATPDIAADRQRRKAIEDALIALHRRETETNLIGNFGRMPPGYSKSKQRRSGERGKRVKTNPRDFREGIDPLPWNNPNDVTSRDWMGLGWSDPEPLSVIRQVPDAPGLYRMWNSGSGERLQYVGESVNLGSRLKTHQYNHDSELRVSYSIQHDYKEKFQLQQAESELLGAHWLACEAPPEDQY